MHVRFIANHLLLATSTGVDLKFSGKNGLPGTAVLEGLASGVGHWALIASVVGVIIGGIMWGFIQQTFRTIMWAPQRACVRCRGANDQVWQLPVLHIPIQQATGSSPAPSGRAWSPTRERGWAFTEASAKAPCRWVAMRHGRSVGSHDHVHFAVSFVCEDRTKASIWRDRIRMSQLCAGAARHLVGLTIVDGRARGGLPGARRPESAAAARRGRPEPERLSLARPMRSAGWPTSASSLRGTGVTLRRSTSGASPGR